MRVKTHYGWVNERLQSVLLICQAASLGPGVFRDSIQRWKKLAGGKGVKTSYFLLLSVVQTCIEIMHLSCINGWFTDKR